MGRTITTIAALLLVFCFFLPWVTVSCSGQPLATVSGQDLAGGRTIEVLGNTQRIDGETILYLVPLSGLIAFLLTLIGGRGAKGASIAQIVVGVVVALMLFYTWSKIQDVVRQNNFDVSLKFGFLGSVFAALGIIAGAVISMGESPSRGLPGDSFDDFDNSWDDW